MTSGSRRSLEPGARSLRRAARRELIEAEDLLRLVDGRDLAPAVADHARRHLDELPVGLRHLAVREIEVVLEPRSDVAAERERRADHAPAALGDPDHLPLAA